MSHYGPGGSILLSVDQKASLQVHLKRKLSTWYVWTGREATRNNQNLTSSTARERMQPVATFASGCATSLACRL